jgi:hypothetical protein
MKVAPKLVDARTNIDMESPILGLDGKELDDPAIVCECGKIARPAGRKIVLRDLCRNALLANEEIDPKEKMDRFYLATLIEKKRSPRLASEDIALLKARIGKSYPPLFVGRAFELLDPASVKHLGGDEAD